MAVLHEDHHEDNPSCEGPDNESGCTSGEGIPSDKVMPITKCPHTSRKHYAKVRFYRCSYVLEYVL
jgi:hypothetical protein